MRVLRWLVTAVSELISLIVDDVLTFVGAVVGLVGTYLLSHHGMQTWAGYLMYAVIWAFLAISLTRATRQRQ